MILRILALTSFLTATTAAAKSDPPPFFLQDPTDSLCLAGTDFLRCSIESLFYVEGTPGNYQIKKRPVKASHDDDLCLVKKSCDATPEALKIGSCAHCGANQWNILGDAESGYVLTYDTNTCVVRQDMQTMTAPCDSEDLDYTALQLRFASAADINAMTSPGARMVGAAADGKLEILRELLSEGVDVNVKDWDELTALIPAASGGHLEVIKFLLEKGADINASDKDGITALMEASIAGHTETVAYLIEQGATVDVTAHSEVNALWLASSEGRVEVMKLLLSKGASATNVRKDGTTALMTASVGGHLEAVKLLLENGADPLATDKENLTALMNAAENGTVPVLAVLTAAAEGDESYLNTVTTSGFSALIIASAHGHTDAVRHLLKAGAGVDVAADSTVTALMYAAAADHVETMKALLDHGANLELQHSNGGTALVEAATGGAAKAIQFLLDAGANVDTQDEDGVTPLMAVASNGNIDGQQAILEALKKQKSGADLKTYLDMLSRSGGSSIMFAASGGHVESTKMLFELGADPNKISKAEPDYLVKLEGMIRDGTVKEEDRHVDGVTALHVAAQGGHLEVVEYLIEKKADVTIEDVESRTPLMMAIKGNYPKVAIALVKGGGDPNTVYVDDDGEEHNLLFDAIVVENEDFAEALIENGADLYYKDDKKVSTLLQASHRGLPKIAKLLLAKHGKGGDYINDPSDEGTSPLSAAASEGHIEVVEALLAAGANVNSKDEDKTTALMAAAARGHVDVIKALLAAKASLNEQNNDGHTALMFAYNGKNQVDTLWARYNRYLKEAEEGADDAGTAAIIQDALDNHVAVVDALLKAGADPTIKDKEGHTAKDFDYHPDADADILEKEAKAEKVRDESKNEL